MTFDWMTITWSTSGKCAYLFLLKFEIEQLNLGLHKSQTGMAPERPFFPFFFPLQKIKLGFRKLVSNKKNPDFDRGRLYLEERIAIGRTLWLPKSASILKSNRKRVFFYSVILHCRASSHKWDLWRGSWTRKGKWSVETDRKVSCCGPFSEDDGGWGTFQLVWCLLRIGASRMWGVCNKERSLTQVQSRQSTVEGTVSCEHLVTKWGTRFFRLNASPRYHVLLCAA